ncbi:MAG: NAD-dependent epimerase/dehydratase family protein, partial [Pelagibacterales bacterium]|nr:NAD-dependent epimerase/dehydratase family protein [Pelagibacterales bacterium]
MAAAKVGGIFYNSNYPADFIFENLKIQNNLIHGAWQAGIKNLIFLGSSCIYPKYCKQPMPEDCLLTGTLESTNEAYAIAKISGIKMCESFNKQYKTNYKCLIPTNAFGPNDNYDPLNSHFIPALIRKLHVIKKNKSKNKKLTIWGNGKAKREIIHSDDISDACVFFMNKKNIPNLINIGTGKEHTIEQYAKLFAKYLDINIKIIFDKSKPNGMARKVMDVSLAKKYGWVAKKLLKESIVSTYRSYLNEK